ncbi:YcaO-like family protein [[Pseudopropionibacterium] massiliense]|uniref:YcaO-like family protein n=1 Tax=[Pseudopropionibacterium] massiliense TaxID=2220000 RepID=UPI001030955A|nr:YcaO-like family protein [[Pseudopropionibacterium] massiliense]
MTFSAHLMQQAVGQRHGMVLPPQRAPLSMADADIVHYGVPRRIDSPWESASGGVARRERDARLAAIGEAVERTASGLVRLPTRPRRDIPSDERIDAEDFALFTPDQRARPGFPHGRIHDPECPYVEVFSLLDNSPVWVPQPFVSLQDPHRTGVPNSSGLAAGPDAHAALLRGVQELIERDALMTTWLHGLSGHAVAPPGSLASEVARLGGGFTVLDLTPAYSPFPVAAVMGGIPKRGLWRYSLGVACKHDWNSAVDKAYLEWNQGVLFAGVYGELADVSRIPKDTDLHSFDEHAMYLHAVSGIVAGAADPTGKGRPARPVAADDPRGAARCAGRGPGGGAERRYPRVLPGGQHHRRHPGGAAGGEGVVAGHGADSFPRRLAVPAQGGGHGGIALSRTGCGIPVPQSETTSAGVR